MGNQKCNMCGKEFDVFDRQEDFQIRRKNGGAIGYGSSHDGEYCDCHLCIRCFDICKVNFYAVEMRNKKVDGEWREVPFYTVQDKLPYGHGEKSVYIINGFLRLKRTEAMAIRWHMGAYADSDKMNTLGQAYDEYPLALMLHMADMLASHLDEVNQ